MTKTLEEIEAELARQDAELACVMAAFEEAAPTNARFDVPSSFFDELADLCRPRALAVSIPLLGLRA